MAVALPIVLGFGPGAFAPLAVFVIGAGALTRLGRAAKEGRGLAEANRGRRGAVHVLAKLALPALLGVAALLRVFDPGPLRLAFTASLAGAFADTAGTEVGPLAGGSTFGLRGLVPATLPHGTPGAVSATGLLAGAGAAAVVSGAALLFGVVTTSAAAIVAALAGFVASVTESALAVSALGARLGHHGRNATLSVLAAGFALAADALGWVAR
jgi:uncharacterized membrane protein